MPHFDQEYCDRFKGKTIERIDPTPLGTCHNHVIVMRFTDGTSLEIASISRTEVHHRGTLIANARKAEDDPEGDRERTDDEYQMEG